MRLLPVNVALTVESVVGETAAAPVPCRKRAMSRGVKVRAVPAMIDAITKMAIPARRMLRRPQLSARRPTVISSAEKIRA